MNKTHWKDWEIVGVLGRGSFGTVYKIQRLLANEQTESAALKVIRIPQSPADIDTLHGEGYSINEITATLKEHLNSIINEYNMMQILEGHSNIVNSKDISYIQHDNGMGWDIFIRMELLTPLMQALPDVVSDETVINLGIDICKALQLCNKHNIVHRDIKPQNIFVSKNGDYKLGDFGIAKVSEKTTFGTRIGTPKYIAPEVYYGQPYGCKADIYSLGLVLYWLLNGKHMPFVHLGYDGVTGSQDEIARVRRLKGEPLPPPANGSEILKKIVLKACAFDPKDRFNSATDLLEELIKIKNNDDETTPINKNGADCDKNKNKNGNKKNAHISPKVFLLLLPLVILIVGLIGFAYYPRNGDDGQTNTLQPETTDVGISDTTQEENYFIVADKTEINAEEKTDLAFHVGEYIYRSQDNLIWTSSNPSVATIDKSGIVTGIEEGAAVISAEMDGKTAQIEITINKTSESAGAGQSITSASQADTTSVKSLELCANTDVILLKDEIGLYLKADGWMLEGESSGINFSTSDSYVATVTQNGILRANAVGICTVSAEYGGKTATKEIKVVKVNENSSASIRSQFENVNLSSGGSTDVMIYFEGNLPEHYNVSVYACGNFQIGLKWGQIQNNAAKLTISDVYLLNRTGEITLLLFAEDNPGVAMAATKIPINIS